MLYQKDAQGFSNCAPQVLENTGLNLQYPMVSWRTWVIDIRRGFWVKYMAIRYLDPLLELKPRHALELPYASRPKSIAKS